MTDLFQSQGLVLATDQAQMAVSPSPLFDDTFKTYRVSVDRRNFEVKLTLRQTISLEHASGPPLARDHRFTQEQPLVVKHIAQCLGILWKEAMTRNFIAVDKNQSTFFLPWKEQVRLKQDAFRKYYVRRQ